MSLKYYLFIVFLFLLSCNIEEKHSGYRLVYKNDKEGNTLSGSKQNLISHIRSGADIKIGWGTKGKTHTIEHLSEPIWIAVLDESEVIAHLDPQVFAKIDWETLSSQYSDSTTLNQEWRVAISTNGEFDAVWIDKITGKLIKRIPQNHPMTWFAKDGTNNNSPFYANE